MIYLATYATIADADAIRSDLRYDREIQFQLNVTLYSAIVTHDLKYLLTRVIDQIVDEIDDDDPDAPNVIDIRHLPEHELSTVDCRMFCIRVDNAPFADLIIRRVND